MMAPKRSSFGIWSFLVVCSLCVFANENMPHDEDGWIDPYDMINYDPTTQRMRKPTESTSYANVPTKRREFSSETCDLQQCPDALECIKKLQIFQKEIEELRKNGADASPKPVCLPVFKRFLAKLLKETSKLGLPDDETTAMHYDAEVKLSKQSLAEIQKLLNEGSDWTTGAMDEALSQILVRFKRHNYEAWKWRFEDTFHVEADTVLKVLMIVLVVVGVICTELWSVVSWFVQFKRMFAVCFFISLIWNWFHLYMMAFAEHKKNIVEVESFNAKCTGLKQLDWKDSLSAWYRRTWTLQDDPCKKYYEVLVVNPILLVPPTKAITVTITNFITDPLKHIGEGISEFLRALLKDLPVTLQIPVLLIIALAIFVFMYGSAQAAIHHAVRFPRLGWRRDPPPPAVGQRENPQLREHEEHLGGGDAPQPLQMLQNNDNRANPVRNRGDQQNRQQDNSMEIRQDFARGPKRTRVETVRPTGNAFSEDETDSQQRTEEVDPGTRENAESEVRVEENKKNASSADKKEQKDAPQESPEKSETPKSDVPPSEMDVKTVGANQGNEGESAVAPVQEVDSSYRSPVQETQQEMF